MTHPYRIHDGPDRYEIWLHRYIISRISYFSNGYRQDVQFDDLPNNIKDKVIELVDQAVEENED